MPGECPWVLSSPCRRMMSRVQSHRRASCSSSSALESEYAANRAQHTCINSLRCCVPPKHGRSRSRSTVCRAVPEPLTLERPRELSQLRRRDDPQRRAPRQQCDVSQHNQVCDARRGSCLHHLNSTLSLECSFSCEAERIFTLSIIRLKALLAASAMQCCCCETCLPFTLHRPSCTGWMS